MIVLTHMEHIASQYLHGTSPEEQQRLSLLNDLLNQGSLQELRLQGGERILDIGSGLGQLARAMARQAGTRGKVVAIERSAEQIAEAKRQALEAGEDALLDLRQGEVLNLPLRDEEWGSFDIAHARFLLEHVPDPHAVVRNMVRAVRVGGRIVLEDDDHDILRLWPEPPGFSPLWEAYMRTFDRLGNDPYVGRRLVELLHDAGAQPLRNTWIFFGGCSGNPSFSAYVENFIGVVVGAREKIVAVGLYDRSFFDEAIDAIRKWQSRPEAVIWYAIAWAEGVRR